MHLNKKRFPRIRSVITWSSIIFTAKINILCLVTPTLVRYSNIHQQLIRNLSYCANVHSIFGKYLKYLTPSYTWTEELRGIFYYVAVEYLCTCCCWRWRYAREQQWAETSDNLTSDRDSPSSSRHSFFSV